MLFRSVDHTPWGFDNRIPLGSATPGIITTINVPNNDPNRGGSINPQLGPDCGAFNVPGALNASGAAIPTTLSSCYSVPLGSGANFVNGSLGPTAPFSASTLNWATFSQNPNYAGPLNTTAGTRNQFNSFSKAYYSPYEDRSGAVMTVDQRLTQDISFYGSAFYSNRRSRFKNSNSQNPAANGALSQFSVPTFNPYYPTGGAPTNLRVSYDLTVEAPA